jgi:hypothetical protein
VFRYRETLVPTVPDSAAVTFRAFHPSARDADRDRSGRRENCARRGRHGHFPERCRRGHLDHHPELDPSDPSDPNDPACHGFPTRWDGHFP